MSLIPTVLRNLITANLSYIKSNEKENIMLGTIFQSCVRLHFKWNYMKTKFLIWYIHLFKYF